MQHKVRYGQYVLKEFSGDMVILVNSYNSKWYRLTNQCFKILDEAVLNELSMVELINAFKEKEDQEYFKRLIHFLLDLGILEKSNDELNVDKTVPKQICYSITHRCNLYCTHCSYNASNITEQETFDTITVMKNLEKIINMNPSLIVITGGEPLVRKDFYKIANFLFDHFGGDRKLMTNATLINNENSKWINKIFNKYEISIDGIDEESCSKVRGSGVFTKVMNGVQLLCAEGTNPEDISLSMVLTKDNEILVSDFKELNQKLGTNPMLRIFSPTGRGQINKDELQPSIASYSLTESTNIETELKNIIGFNCDAIRNRIFVDFDGSIYPCATMPSDEFKLGNILHIDDLKRYFIDREYKKTEGYQKFISILPYNSTVCRDCKIKLFCAPCPFHNYVYSKQEYFEKYCQIKKIKLSSIWRR